jgi:hypothetical protein
MPFKSRAQRRKFAELLVKGEISPETFEEWNRSTGSARLPERVKPKAKPRKRGRKKKTTTSKAPSRARSRVAAPPKKKPKSRTKRPRR